MIEQARSLTKLLHQRAWNERFPLSGTFELSPICNLACKMCYVRKTPAEVAAHHRSLLSLEQWKELGDQAEKLGTLFLLLTGGEPFLWPDFRELYEYLHQKGFLLSVNTNGTLIDDDTVLWLQEHPPARINITLYGASNESYQRLCGAEGMFQRVSESVERLLKAKIPIKLNTSLTPYNAGDLEKIVQFAQDKNVLCDVGTYMFPPIRRDAGSVGCGERFTPEEAALYQIKYRELTLSHDSYMQYLKRTAEGIVLSPGLDESCIDPADGTVKCQAGHGTFWVTWDGYLIPCGMVMEPKEDLLESDFSSAWKNLTIRTEQVRLSGVCQNCENKKVCHTCMAAAYAETGRHSGIPKYLCQLADALKKQATERLADE